MDAHSSAPYSNPGDFTVCSSASSCAPAEPISLAEDSSVGSMAPYLFSSIWLKATRPLALIKSKNSDMPWIFDGLPSLWGEPARTHTKKKTHSCTL